MGEERLSALLRESLTVAVKTGAMQPSDTRRVIEDTTVQPKNVMFPIDAKLMHRARARLDQLVQKLGLTLRQSYTRVGKLALIKHQRYARAKQMGWMPAYSAASQRAKIVVLQPRKGEAGIPGKGYHHRDRSGKERLSVLHGAAADGSVVFRISRN